ncbi:TPA: hypothetical protein ACIAIE_004819 [Serratia fonticola]
MAHAFLSQKPDLRIAPSTLNNNPSIVMGFFHGEIMPTQNPVPSNSFDDLIFNAEKFDEVMTGVLLTYTDRLGNIRYTIAGLESKNDNLIASLTANYTNVVNNLTPLGKVYTLSAANAAIASGEISDGSFFFIRSASDKSIADEYQNIGGVATASGKAYPSTAFVVDLSGRVFLLEDVTKYISLVIPQAQANKISGYQFVVTDVTGNTGLLGINDNGGLEIPGVVGNVQSYMTSLVSETFSSKISGYQYVWLTADMETAVAAIDDNGYLWLAGMTDPVQTAIANACGGGAERLIKPDGTGKIALFASEDDTTPLWSYYPVSSAEKVTDTGISFIYNQSGTLKSALIPTWPVIGVESIREINSESLEMHWFAGRGQSLEVGANGGPSTPIASLLGYALMFSGAGRDRGAGIDGPVTDDTLGALVDLHQTNLRNNCRTAAAETILLKHESRSSPLPIVTTRLDARGGFTYNQLKKGTQPYIDGTTSFDSFCKRTESIGKVPVCKCIGFTHGEADANNASLQFGTYKGYLTQWADDTQADMMARSGQTTKPWLDVNQLGSLTNTTVINGITQRGYTVAIDQWEFTLERAEAIQSVPRWFFNRLFPQDFLHLTATGYRRFGEYQGIAEDWTIYDRINNPTGAKFKPVQPESIVKVNATTFDITFNSPFGKPLQILAVDGITAPNLGCDLQDGTANVVSAMQQSDFVFRFITDVAPSVGDYFRFGCNATDNGVNSYPLVNIFDTTTTVSRYDPSFAMVNPCVISRIAVI